MVAVGLRKTSVNFYQTVRRNTSEKKTFHTLCCENHKSNMICELIVLLHIFRIIHNFESTIFTRTCVDGNTAILQSS
jgi:hypothetical protein